MSHANPDYSTGYKRYVLFLLLLVYVSNFMDRQILNILLEPIKQDLALSDTQLGFLSGIAFAIFYATLGIPLARWADSHNRVKLITACIGVWSVMTALCGAAANFVQLIAARIGVGVGEAGCSPPAHSLIADYFEPSRRARAIAIYCLGIPLGSTAGLMLGGWINEIYGWRIAFMAVGLPGLALALLVRLTLKEPPRGHSDGPRHVADAPPPMGETFRVIWALKSFRHMAIATALLAVAGYGAATWFPAFLIRSHGMGTGEIGATLGPIAGLAGLIGTILGGQLADRLGAGNVRWYAWVPGLGMLIGIPFSIAALLVDSKVWVMALIFIPSLVPAMHAGPVFSTVQNLVPPRMRSTAAAILLFIINLIGIGLGPLVIGVVSDLLQAMAGQESLRLTLLFGTAISAWSAVHYALAARYLPQDLASNSAIDPAQTPA